MMDCKKALEETAGDLEKAVDVLRTKGAAKADKRAGREASQGLIGHYLHHDGQLGVLVELNCETDFVARTEDFKTLARELAIHIAAKNPLAVRIEDLPAETVARERQVYEAQVAEQKKPENIRAKIVEGMIKRFYEENVLLEQTFVKDDKRTVGELVKISGESFAGTRGAGGGIDFSVIDQLGDELKHVAGLGVQLGLVVGGGNILRGTAASEQGMDRVSADYMGMLATVINALALQVIFEGGTGNPYFSTDTAAVLRALEIESNVLLKATNVD